MNIMMLNIATFGLPYFGTRKTWGEYGGMKTWFTKLRPP